MKEVTDKLLAEGVQLFADAFAKLLKAVEKQSQQAGAGRLNRLTYTLPEELTAAVKGSLAEWRAQGKVRRLWGRDASLWSGGMRRSGSAGSASPTTSWPTSSA